MYNLSFHTIYHHLDGSLSDSRGYGKLRERISDLPINVPITLEVDYRPESQSTLSFYIDHHIQSHYFTQLPDSVYFSV